MVLIKKNPAHKLCIVQGKACIVQGKACREKPASCREKPAPCREKPASCRESLHHAGKNPAYTACMQASIYKI